MTFSRLHVVLALTLAFAPLSCKRAKSIHVQQTEEEGPRLASVVHVSDPKVEPQLVSGFYSVESNAWRWTAREFTVVLRVPGGAAQRGARLDVDLTVPPVTIEKLKTISLSATADGHALRPETYTEAGQFHYQRDLDPGMLANSSARLEFKLDKVMPPANGDLRELGIIVASIGLEAK